jgi:hypothetical protein
MAMPAPSRTVVEVGGAGVVLDAALTAGNPRAAANCLRLAAPKLDLAEARAATVAEGRSVVVATGPAGQVLALRWFAPEAATPIRDHGSWGAAVVLDRYDRFELLGDQARLDATFWLEAGDTVWWDGPPADVHRQTGTGTGALELIVVGGPPTGYSYDEHDALGETRPLADAVRTAYLTQDAAPIAAWYADDVIADLCVPAWRFQLRGRDQLVALLATEELGLPDQRLTSFRALPLRDGVVVEAAVRFTHDNATRAWRDLHVLRTRDGRVVEHLAYCTGHWDAAAIAAQEATAPMVRP